ncbi:hypothetical protein ACLOJK_003915 [Asimina triloba]
MGKRKPGDVRGMGSQPHFRGGEGARVARARTAARLPRGCQNLASPCVAPGQRAARPLRRCRISNAPTVASGVAAHPLRRCRISRIR